MRIINVVPVDEVDKHEITEKCPCNPQVDKMGAGREVIVHNLINGKKYFVIVPGKREWSKTPFTTIEINK